MGSTDLRLVPGLQAGHKLTPKAFFRLNLLTVPAAQLFELCSEAVSGNIFVSFHPPKNMLRSLDDENADYENIAQAETLDSALELQIAECPGFSSITGRGRDPLFWSSLLNEKGFMNCSEEEAASAAGCTVRQVSEYLEMLRMTVEPAGLFAADLRSSLILQLKRRGLECSDAYTLLADEEMTHDRSWPQNVVKSLGWGGERAELALRTLKTLDPAPGKNFQAPRFCLPDIEFEIVGGEVSVRLILDNMPSVACGFSELPLSPTETVRSAWARPEWRSAKDVLTKLGLRYRTILRIALLIKEFQKDMISDMDRPPAPLTYEQAAGLLGLHASTVFRAVKDSFCRIKTKNYPMRMFFCRASSSRPDMSAAQIRAEACRLRTEGLTNREIGKILGIPVRTASYYTGPVRQCTVRNRTLSRQN